MRSDVNVIMFDEPLTVIDPHLKWVLRSKLKELHQRIRRTMIYVTHDQTEALTFAEQVVVMKDGEVVQIGTPVELFERPKHTFVGHFIGSPGMNVLPCEREGRQGDRRRHAGRDARTPAHYRGNGKTLELGVRPEFVTLRRRAASRSTSSRSPTPAATASSRRATASSVDQAAGAGGRADPDRARRTSASIPAIRSIYEDGWMVSGRADEQDRQPEGLVLRPAGRRCWSRSTPSSR